MPYLKDVDPDSVHLVGNPAIRERFYAIVKSANGKQEDKPIKQSDGNWLKEDKIDLDNVDGAVIVEKLKELLLPYKEKIPIDISNVLWNTATIVEQDKSKDESTSSSITPPAEPEKQPTQDAVKPVDEDSFLLSDEAQEYLRARVAEIAASV